MHVAHHTLFPSFSTLSFLCMASFVSMAALQLSPCRVASGSQMQQLAIFEELRQTVVHPADIWARPDQHQAGHEPAGSIFQ